MYLLGNNIRIFINLTFNSKTGPKHSVIGEMRKAVKTMANVIRVDRTSFSSPNACVGSESFSYVSTGVDD